MPQRGWTYLPGWNDGLSQQHKFSSCSKKDKEDDSWYYTEMQHRREEGKNEEYIKKKLKNGLWYGDNIHGIFTRDINNKEVRIIGYKRISLGVHKLIFKHTK